MLMCTASADGPSGKEKHLWSHAGGVVGPFTSPVFPMYRIFMNTFVQIVKSYSNYSAQSSSFVGLVGMSPFAGELFGSC